MEFTESPENVQNVVWHICAVCRDVSAPSQVNRTRVRSSGDAGQVGLLSQNTVTLSYSISPGRRTLLDDDSGYRGVMPFRRLRDGVRGCANLQVAVLYPT